MVPIRRTASYNADQSVLTLSRLKTRMADAEERASTGLRIQLPSDAPEIWTSMNRLRAEQQDQVTYMANADRGETWLAASENALKTVSDILKRVKERAIQLGSDTISAEDRTNGANEINALRQELIDVANTQLDGRYLFSGTALNVAAFDQNGVYQGSNEIPDMQVGRDTRVSTGYDGSQVLQGAVNTFQVLSDLSTALAANDSTAVRNMISTVDAGIEQNIQWWEENGYRTATMDDMKQIASNLDMLSQNQLGNLVNADPAQSFTELAELRSNYEATLAVVGSSRSTNLFNYIG